MAFQIQPRKASRKKLRARATFNGPAGSGKTYTALGLATAIAQIDPGERGILMVDTQGGQGDAYADDFEFDVVELAPEDHDPHNLIKVIEYAESEGYSVVIVDSLSHAWEWTLKRVNTLQSGRQNKWTAWGEGGGPWEELMQKVLFARVHVLCTARSKMAYSQEKDERGKTEIKKVGMAPRVRDGSEFEFDLVCEMTAPDNTLVVAKARARGLNGEVAKKPGPQFFKKVTDWMFAGDEAPDKDQPSAVDAMSLKKRIVALRDLNENAKAAALNLGDEYGFSKKWSALTELGPVASHRLSEKLDELLALHSDHDAATAPAEGGLAAEGSSNG
jgi:hypothetical protein